MSGALLGAGLETVANLYSAGSSCEFLGEFVIHPVLNQKTVGAHAGLAGVSVFRGHGALDGCINIRIVENDERRIAPEFEGDFFYSLRTLRHEQLAYFGGTRKT